MNGKPIDNLDYRDRKDYGIKGITMDKKLNWLYFTKPDNAANMKRMMELMKQKNEKCGYKVKNLMKAHWTEFVSNVFYWRKNIGGICCQFVA